eukprot:TRINITY_DN7681_c0_g1_i1.p1 TRINITY_DN7681_c0_g1~~TRINITY_DN7681_c0_g1_i1.p1  ORF type:complete len:699 (-),score=91.17 TRINITY_DN7681_c0_g1_i1:281-2377(-)
MEEETQRRLILETADEDSLSIKPIKKKYRRGRRRVCTFVGALFFIYIISVGYTALQYTFIQQQYFSDENLKQEFKEEEVRDSFGSERLRNDRIESVVVVVIDGLRFDYVERHPEFRGFLTQPSFKQDSKYVKLRCQLPTISLPNWNTLVTSVPPEIHGITANRARPNKIDNIFARAEAYSVTRGLASNDEWYYILKSHMQPLVGDASSVYLAVDEDPGQSTIRHVAQNHQDELTGQVLVSAVGNFSLNESSRYGLFWSYFSDVDSRSHQHGAFAERTMSAVSNKTKILKELLKVIDEKTVLIITADHGHVDVGGHNGYEDATIDIPFVIYQKSSSLGNQETAASDFPTSLDVAPSIAALLGIPAPRLSQGGILPTILPLLNSSNLEAHYRDLLVQKRKMVDFAVRKLSGEAPVFANESSGDVASIQNEAKDILDIYARARQAAINKHVATNVIIGIVASALVLLLLLIILHKVTLCDVLSVFRLRDRSPMALRNRRAFIGGFGATLLFWMVAMTLFAFFARFTYRGYSDWKWTGSTMNSGIDGYILYIGTSILGAVVSLITQQIAHVTLCTKGNSRRYLQIITFRYCFNSTVELDSAMMYLLRYYQIFWASASTAVLLVLNCVQWLLIPPLRPLLFITPTTWNLRFRVITAFFLWSPHFLVSIALLFVFWPRKTNWKTIWLIKDRTVEIELADSDIAS